MLDIPPAWESIDLPDAGLVMVIGAPDTGKSTLARYLYQRQCRASRPVAFLDGDPGQSALGPPTSMTLALGAGDDDFPPCGFKLRRFAQSTSPRGHMLPMLVNAARLIQAARDAGAQAIVYDTSGFVDPAQGGASLKLAKIELLRPALIVAIQRQQELAALLGPLRRGRTRLVELSPSHAVQPRDMATRQAYRASQFARYFSGARARTLDWRRWTIWPAPRFQFQQLAALEDGDGFTLELGIVLSADATTRHVTLLTPLASQKDVGALRLGDVTLDPQTFRDQPLRET